ncbi:NUDIX domain-containing protein [Streptacidiphilus griseoplanus]|uniref:NUDIX domain-containing protein n=1 Tax=Peterkaempfera griseoplana TaxID=66896 RepID=UPI001FE0E0BE|nr:NUDIX domain-containing protein [Peterkaempfera griseoplana]
MATVRLRHSVRAIVLDEEDRILLCRHTAPEPPGTVVWAAPGGGVERGETPADHDLKALEQIAWARRSGRSGGAQGSHSGAHR